MNTRLNNIGTYKLLDTYSGGNHPPFNSSSSIMQDNKDSLTVFLYNILDCNPGNLQKPNQKNCSNSPQPLSFDEFAYNEIDATIYPNPFNTDLNITLNEINNTTISIINIVGKEVVRQKVTSYINKINLAHLPIGIYLVRISSNENIFTQKVIKK